MSDVPVLHAGDKIFIESGPGMTPIARANVRLEFAESGIQVLEWTEASGSGYHITAIIRDHPWVVSIKDEAH